MYISLIEELRKYIQTYKMHNKIKHIKYFSRFVYDQLGLKKSTLSLLNAMVILAVCFCHDLAVAGRFTLKRAQLDVLEYD